MEPGEPRQAFGRGLMLVVLLIGSLSFALAAAGAAAAPAAQTPTPHSTEGRQNCLACHAPGGGVSPAPANHAGYNNTTCLGCHKLAEQSAPPAQAPRDPSAACQDCHANRDLKMTFASGETLDLFVDANAMAGSVHSGKVSCGNCHRDITGYPHRPVPAQTKRDYSLRQYELCRSCHFDEYTKTLDGMHYRALTEGDTDAPLCTDCHGNHAVTAPGETRNKISTLCGKCHAQVYTQYAGSIHGAALLQNGNADVPVCTDCHSTHSIADTQAAAFHLDIPLLCARCHSDPALAAKYGLKANVYETYTRDFHGSTVLLERVTGDGRDVEVAVCNDCHGTHDIRPLNEGTAQQTRQRALTRCQQCHPAAGDNFPEAWLGHFEVSFADTPAVWLIRAGYTLLIPYIIVGLALFIGADLWRAWRRRRGESS